MIKTPIIPYINCEEVTSAGGRGSAGSNTSSAKEALSESSVEMFTKAEGPREEGYKNTKGRVAIEVCSEEDVKYKRGGCSTIKYQTNLTQKNS